MVFPTKNSLLMNKRVVLIRMGGELGIKSRQTRRRMVNLLMHNIKTILEEFSGYRIINFRDRLIVFHESKTELNEVAHRLINSISGISSISVAYVVQATEASMVSSGLSEALASVQPYRSFAVRVRREGDHPFSSMDIARELGAKILSSQLEGIKVNLDDPDFEISLDIRGSLAFIFTKTLRGMDGIPSKSQGTTMALIRPNLNSIIAAWLMKKRGVEIIPVFFRTGKSSEKDYLNYLESEFGQTPIDISIEDLLETFRSHPSLCLFCTIFCEQVCQKLATDQKITTIVSPTCFNYNSETISLEALKILEKKAFLSILRPIQFGFFNRGFEIEYLDQKSCCPHRSKVSLQLPDDFSKKLEEFLSFKLES
ncbi:MAG: THUMP domain-containing protein [Candidatus Hodarchaeales archaeon]